MKFDHIALKSKDITTSIRWYKENCKAKILYQDESWALIDVNGGKIAFVLPTQHPPHVGIQIDKDIRARQFSDKTFKYHRDGSESCYVQDPDGNFVEFIIYNEAEE